MTSSSPADAGLREALAGAFLRHEWPWQSEVPFADQPPRIRDYWLAIADSYIAGPLAGVLAGLATERRARAEAERERDEARETWMDEHGTTWRPPTAWAYAQACRVMHEAKARLTAAEAENARLRAAVKETQKALRPFAIAAEVREPIDSGRSDNIACFSGLCSPTAGDFRRARAALAASSKEATDEQA